MLEKLIARVVERVGEDAVRLLFESLESRDAEKAASNARLIAETEAAEEAIHQARVRGR
jgi:hypothetical protein